MMLSPTTMDHIPASDVNPNGSNKDDEMYL